MDNQKAGGIYFDVGMNIEPFLTTSKRVDSTLDNIASSAQSTGKSLDGMGKNTKSASSSLNQIAASTKSVDGSMQTLNTTVSAMAIAIQQANTSSAAASMTLAQMNGAMNSLIGAANSIAEAMRGAGTSTSTASNEFSRAESIIEGLGNQLAILDEAQENGARSAAILAAQLRAGAGATDTEKEKIGELTGQLYDMKNGTDAGAKSHVNWKNSMQQAGYQVQDFIVQVQGGQSAIVAFSQQGSQLAGAFGPGGAVVGAIIALGSVIVGTLVKSMGNAEDTMKGLATATNALDQVITISQGGVAALSDKYALLAKTNAKAATILRNQALIEYNQAISKLPDAITDASTSLFGFGDSAKAAFSGGMVGISAFNDILKAADIQTSSVSEAFSELSSNAGVSRGSIATFSATIGALSSNFGISEQQAFDLAKQLEVVSNAKTPESLQALVIQLQSMTSSTKDGKAALDAFIVNLSKLATSSYMAQLNVSALKGEMDNLTAGQKNLIQQSRRDLALSKLQGAARARLQALYKSEDAGFSANSPQAIQMQNEAEQTYKNTQATKDNNKAKTGLANAEESVTQKLEQLRQQSDLNAVSSQNLTLEQAKLRAEMSLGKNATAAQRAEAAKYAESIWQQAAALKARNLIPEVAENDDYSDKQAQLDLLKNQTDSHGKLLLSEQQYNEQSEKLAQQHLVNLQKIQAQEPTSNPIASARAEVDPIQQLTNQYNQQKSLSEQYQAEELAILQAANAKKLINDEQYQAAKATTENQYRMLRTAADNQYDEQRTAAEWQLLSQQGLGYQTLTNAVDTFSQSAGSALTSVITGASSGREAMEQLGQAILSSVVNTLVQAAVQALIVKPLLAAFGMTAESSLGASTAAAGESYAAWAPAAVAASIATLGTAAGTGLAAYAGATLAGTAIGKGRKNGGPVNAGGVYPVGEGNLPEFLQTNNGLFMIPGSNGRVFSNKDITGDNGQPVIPKTSTGSQYLSNSGNSNNSTTDKQSGNIQVNMQFVDQTTGGQHSFQAQAVQQEGVVTVTGFLTDMASGGPMSSTVQSMFGLSRKATGDY